MNKKITILVLVLAVMAVVSGCGKKIEKFVTNDNITKDDNKLQKTEKKATTTGEIIEYIEGSEIDISNWEIYHNKLHGFQVRYPLKYLDNKDYEIWEIDKNVKFEGNDWGVNKYQETIIHIQTYPAEKENDVFQHFKFSFLNKKIILTNNIIAKRVKGLGCETWYIRHKKNIYIISSSFCFDSKGAELEYSEYRNIMNSIKFDK